jgi:hypothetical protein
MPFELIEHNSGIDGWDAHSHTRAVFTTKEKAIAWLTKRGFTHKEYDSYRHEVPEKRHTMCEIYYRILPARESAEIDPE